MFNALTQPAQQIWLFSLLVLWAVLLFGGFIVGSGDPARRMPTWSRMASSAVLVVAALSWFVFARGTAAAGYALLIAVGMACGFVGDLWLAGLLPGGRNVLGGMAAFGVGHFFYVSAFLRQGNTGGQSLAWGVLLVWLLVGVAGWYLVVLRGRGPSLITWVALAYALLLSTTAGLATSLALQDSRFIPLAIGAALFLLSDLILAGELFADLQFPLIGDVVWLTYGPAQMLIVYSTGAVLATMLPG